MYTIPVPVVRSLVDMTSSIVPASTMIPPDTPDWRSGSVVPVAYFIATSALPPATANQSPATALCRSGAVATLEMGVTLPTVGVDWKFSRAALALAATVTFNARNQIMIGPPVMVNSVLGETAERSTAATENPFCMLLVMNSNRSRMDPSRSATTFVEVKVLFASSTPMIPTMEAASSTRVMPLVPNASTSDLLAPRDVPLPMLTASCTCSSRSNTEPSSFAATLAVDATLLESSTPMKLYVLSGDLGIYRYSEAPAADSQ